MPRQPEENPGFYRVTKITLQRGDRVMLLTQNEPGLAAITLAGLKVPACEDLWLACTDVTTGQVFYISAAALQSRNGLFFGREPAAGIKLDHDYDLVRLRVSRNHFKVCSAAEGFTVEDIMSGNGLYAAEQGTQIATKMKGWDPYKESLSLEEGADEEDAEQIAAARGWTGRSVRDILLAARKGA